MSRVLVTGGSGFIGRHAVAALVEAGHEVHVVSRRPPSTRPPPGVIWHQSDLLLDPIGTVAEVAPDRLLHLAWCTEPGRCWSSLENVLWVEATLALVRTFAAFGGTRAVFAGSCAEYEWGPPGPCVERSTSLRPATLYGISKDATRAVVEAAATELDLSVAWGRVFFLYGPAEDRRRLVAAVAHGLATGERVATSAGTQRRDFLHVSDVGGAFAAILDADACGPINIGSGQAPPLRALIDTLGEVAGRPELLDVGALPQRPGDPEELLADNTRLRDEVGFRPRVRLSEGLATTFAWWRDQARARSPGSLDVPRPAGAGS